MADQPSVFDRPEWLSIGPPPALGCITLTPNDLQRRFYVLTRLPRLMVLVRAMKNGQGDAALARRSVHLAKELLHLDWTEAAQNPPAATVVPTRREEDAAQVPLSFKFATRDHYDVIGYAMFWACKIILSGLCRSLYECGAPIEWPSLGELNYEERRCATLISMSVDHAESLMPYGSVPMIFPMQIAWGVYWRQRHYAVDVDAKEMMEWHCRRANKFLSSVNAQPTQMAGLIFLTERLQGGRLLQEHFFTARAEAPKTLESAPDFIKMEGDPYLEGTGDTVQCATLTVRYALPWKKQAGKLTEPRKDPAKRAVHLPTPSGPFSKGNTTVVDNVVSRAVLKRRQGCRAALLSPAFYTAQNGETRWPASGCATTPAA